MDMPTFEELLHPIKLNFRLSGVTFSNSKLHIEFYVYIVLMIIILIEEWVFIYSQYSPETFLEITYLMPCSCSGVLSTLKWLLIVAKRQKILDLVKNLNALYRSILVNPKKVAIMRNETIFVKNLNKYFIKMNWILICIYNFSPLLTMLKDYIQTKELVLKLPFALISPFSIDTWPMWSIVYLHSVICGFTCVLFYTSNDALYCLLTSQICNNLAIISNELMTVEKSNTYLLKELVINHQYVLKLAEDLEEIFRLPNLFNVLVGSIQICALGFNLTMGGIGQIPGCMLFFISVLLQILMMSVFGEKLIGESRKVGDAAFSCNWCDMDERSKKTILIIMTRARKPQQLTAYKFSVISYECFTKIISTSWSYFTILKTVYTPPEIQVDPI